MSTTSTKGQDEIAARVGEAVRDAEKDDALFERVARGEATAEEIAKLEAEATQDDAIAVRLEASRPFKSDAVDRLVAKIAPPTKTNTNTNTKPEANAKVVSLESKKKIADAKPSTSWLRRLIPIAGPLALAAAVLFVIAGPRLGPSGPELPAYSIVASGEQSMRGGPAPAPSAALAAEGSPRLQLSASAGREARDARFEIILRPATAPTMKVVAFAFTMSDVAAAEPNPLEAKVEISPEGAVRLTGAARKLDGAKEIRVVLGSPTAIGKFDDAIARAKAGRSDREVRVATIPIDRPAAPSPTPAPSP